MSWENFSLTFEFVVKREMNPCERSKGQDGRAVGFVESQNALFLGNLLDGVKRALVIVALQVSLGLKPLFQYIDWNP